jgi:uncharacterized repeat protein (TIGR01451 family)
MRNRYERLVAAAGAAALAGGLVTLRVARGSVPSFDAVLYAAGGVLGGVMTYVAYRDWPADGGVDPPAVERAGGHPYPGERFDRTLAQFAGSGRGSLPDRNSIRDRVRDLATSLLVRRDATTRSAAGRAVAEGEWPPDRRVAAFLADAEVPDADGWVDRARSAMGRDDGLSAFQRAVRRSVDALADCSRIEGFGAEAGESTVALDPGEADSHERTTRWRDDAPGSADLVDGGQGARGDRSGVPVDVVATGRWRLVVPVGLAFVGFGFLFRTAPVVLAGAVALGLAAYARAFAAPEPSLAVERSVDPADPAPGDTVEVTTTVRNDGDGTVPTLTVVDGVPERLAVTEGSPRRGATLRPGESTSVTYEVTARRGVHEFGPLYAVARDWAGASASVRLYPTTGDSAASLTCVPSVDPLPVAVPLYRQSGEFVGRLPAGGGEGTAFHSTREYRPGDSLSRIDWNHLARSADDELTTVRFREERAATVALVVDTYPVAYLAAGPDDPGAVERSLGAAGRLLDSLLASGDRVGLAALGATPCWVDPDSGTAHRERVTELLATDPAFPPTPSGDGEYHSRWVREFHRRFPAETQVVLLSPLCDRRYRYLVRQLRGYGHPVTVVSPDPTVDGTVGQRLVRLERRLRIERLRETGVRVIDWGRSESLPAALNRAEAGWSG